MLPKYLKKPLESPKYTVWQNKYFINFTAGCTYLPLCFRKLMDMILFNASLWTGHLRLFTLGNSWDIHIIQDITFKIVKVPG